MATGKIGQAWGRASYGSCDWVGDLGAILAQPNTYLHCRIVGWAIIEGFHLFLVLLFY
jgi:hypothetical protein